MWRCKTGPGQSTGFPCRRQYICQYVHCQLQGADMTEKHSMEKNVHGSRDTRLEAELSASAGKPPPSWIKAQMQLLKRWGGGCVDQTHHKVVKDRKSHSLHPCFPRMERTEVLLVDTDRRLKLGGEEIEKKYCEQIYAVQMSVGSTLHIAIDRFFFFFFFSISDNSYDYSIIRSPHEYSKLFDYSFQH